jgi:hypothetical protein
LALNEGYARDRRPINVQKRLGELTIDDYEGFVRFWCDPQIVSSPRTGQNYIRAFRQMLARLKVPRPDDFDEVFSIKVPKARNIARYNAELLKPLLNCGHERAKLFALLCLNCGMYAIDIVRLRPEHVTDAEGHPTTNGHFQAAREDLAPERLRFDALALARDEGVDGEAQGADEPLRHLFPQQAGSAVPHEDS